jgi:hypothetical protein
MTASALGVGQPWRRAHLHQMLGVYRCMGHTVSRRGLNLIKRLRRHLEASAIPPGGSRSALRGAPGAMPGPNSSKPNPRKSKEYELGFSWILLDSFVRFGAFQRVAVKEKNFRAGSRPRAASPRARPVCSSGASLERLRWNRMIGLLLQDRVEGNKCRTPLPLSRNWRSFFQAEESTPLFHCNLMGEGLAPGASRPTMRPSKSPLQAVLRTGFVGKPFG